MKPYQKTKPYRHQSECLDLMKTRSAFAVFMEQGLGKTKVLLDDAARMYLKGAIDGMLIVAPNGVHLNWSRIEIKKHLSNAFPWYVFEYRSSKTNTKSFKDHWRLFLECDGLLIFCMNVEALSSGSKAFEFAKSFLRKRVAIMAVDESSRIKTPKSKRTRRVLYLGKMVSHRRIATGTPVTQTPLDLYAQFRFLDPNILGFSSFYSFKHHYAEWDRECSVRAGRNHVYETLESYKNMDQLRQAIAPWSYRRTKEECLDLPKKVYQIVTLPMTPKQRSLYRTLDEEGLLNFDDFQEIVPNQLVKLLRLQQVTGGFLPADEPESIYDGSSVQMLRTKPIPGANNKLKYLVEALEDDYPGKAIVWARFRAEIHAIVNVLRDQFSPESVVELHGGVTGEQRAINVDRFQTDPSCRFLVGQQASGIGITLTAAENVFYYSNPFSYEHRFQSEDRAHRIGLHHPVVYIDLVMEGEDGPSVDGKVLDVLIAARDVAREVMGDDERQRLDT